MKYLRYLYARYVTSLWRRLGLVFEDFDSTAPILIYQMGKVGSSSVYESLKRSGLENPVYHVHFLSYSHLDQIEKYHRSVGARGSIGALRFWRALRRKIDRGSGVVYLISLVREPVAREISDVFQNMSRHHGELLTDAGDVDIEKTAAFLSRGFASFDETTDYTCTWFDREILDSFGLDVYATPFDHALGYSIIKNDRASLLLLRMEDISSVFEAAMQEFLGRSIPMRRANETASKGYARAYRQLLQKFSLSRAAGDKIYASRYARHFYPDGIRGELMKKWMATDTLELT